MSQNTFIGIPVAFFLMTSLAFGMYNAGRAYLGPKRGEDFAQYYVSSRMVLAGESENIYDQGESYQQKARAFIANDEAPAGAIVMTNAYPPTVAVLLIPLALLPFSFARNLFFAFSLSLALAAPFLFFEDRSMNVRWPLIKIGVALTLLYFPLYYSLYMGQINSLVLFLCLLSLVLLRKNRGFLAGLSLGIAVVIKIFPAILLLLFLVQRKYRAVLSTIGTSLAFSGLTLPLIPLATWERYAFEILPMQYHGGAFFRNQGIAGVLTRMLTENDFLSPLSHQPLAASWMSLAANLLVLTFLVLWLLRIGRREDANSKKTDLAFALTVTGALLMLSKSWEHYAVFLLPAFFLVLESGAIREEGPTFPFLAGALSFGIWAFTFQTGEEYSVVPDHWIMHAVVSVKCLATLLLFISLPHLGCRQRGKGAPV